MNEKELQDRQRRAYENRDMVQPGDILILRCTGIRTGCATESYAVFPLPDGELVIDQSLKSPIFKGESVSFRCTEQSVKANGYGPFVDYRFTVEKTGGSCIIDGANAQTVAEKKYSPKVIHNRDIPVLQEVLPCMQAVCQTEKLRDWQRDRMVHITQSLSGMPGGGSPKGLDAAFAALDDLSREQEEACKDYVRHLRKAQGILNGIESMSMRMFVLMKYMMNLPDGKIRQELNMTRRGIERARKAVQDAPSMAAVKWQERYILEQ